MDGPRFQSLCSAKSQALCGMSDGNLTLTNKNNNNNTATLHYCLYKCCEVKLMYVYSVPGSCVRILPISVRHCFVRLEVRATINCSKVFPPHGHSILYHSCIGKLVSDVAHRVRIAWDQKTVLHHINMRCL